MYVHMLLVGAVPWSTFVHSQAAEKVVDLQTRPGVTQRLPLAEVPGAKAAVVLLAGGHRQRPDHVAAR
jgi:hypothetical protein